MCFKKIWEQEMCGWYDAKEMLFSALQAVDILENQLDAVILCAGLLLADK